MCVNWHHRKDMILEYNFFKEELGMKALTGRGKGVVAVLDEWKERRRAGSAEYHQLAKWNAPAIHTWTCGNEY